MHIPVLLDEVINALPKKGVHIDATLGAGGHLKKLLDLGVYDKIIAIDRDPEALRIAKNNLKNSKQNIKYICDEFRNLEQILKDTGIQKINSILFDLGLSSMQLDTPQGFTPRGFSFLRNEPLSMAMSGNGDFTAKDIVNNWSENSLADALYHLADEKYSKKIAKAICQKRQTKLIETTFELVEIIEQALPKKFFNKTHPATKTFQALRMLVNEELQNIETALDTAWKFLAKDGVIAVITFHSIEDRIVKQKFKIFNESLQAELVSKKPIKPTALETEHNKRSRSAKLRIIKKIK